jgi:bifunctional non-homologous end joining protein LigD
VPNLLNKYQSMRDFGDTPEPSGRGRTRQAAKPIFVIQKHQASHLHYDFRLEMEGVLKSWAVPKGPSYDPDTKRLAMMTEDHPYAYAAFEGVIPGGNYGAGNVIIWDEGTWEFIEPGDDPVKALRQGKLTFRMHGKKMFGEWALVRIHGRSTKGNEWLLLKHRDEFANDQIDVTKVAPRSVVSQRTVEEVSAENVWISNRSAKPRGTTLQARLEREDAEKKRSKPPAKRTATKSTKAAPAKGAARRPAAGTAKTTVAKAAPVKRKAAKPAAAASAATGRSRKAATAKTSAATKSPRRKVGEGTK